jgi:branched-chain amino acid transport system ATP-binding protein
MSALLELRGVSAAYGQVKALNRISLTVRDGEVVCLLGSNGAGKTTTIRTIMGILAPTEGEIYLGGVRIDGLMPARIVQMGVAVVPEGRRLFPKMTTEENLRLGALYVRNEDTSQQRLGEVFDLFPVLRERRGQLAGTLSGGEQSMVAIGRALMGNPRLLLFDEPCLGLAPLIVAQIFEVIAAIARRGTTVLLIEQNATRALAVASRGYVLEKGRVVAEGRADDLARSGVIRGAYLKA